MIVDEKLALSERFRQVAKRWVALDSAARLLEESKTSTLAMHIARQGDIPHNRAENNVKASDEWHDYLKTMVEAREQANLAKVELEWIRMKFSERQSLDANRRAEMKLV